MQIFFSMPSWRLRPAHRWPGWSFRAKALLDRAMGKCKHYTHTWSRDVRLCAFGRVPLQGKDTAIDVERARGGGRRRSAAFLRLRSESGKRPYS
jgi:hypothetical protein